MLQKASTLRFGVLLAPLFPHSIVLEDGAIEAAKALDQIHNGILFLFLFLEYSPFVFLPVRNR